MARSYLILFIKRDVGDSLKAKFNMKVLNLPKLHMLCKKIILKGVGLSSTFGSLQILTVKIRMP